MPYFRHQSILGELYFDKNGQATSKPKQKKAVIVEPKGEKLQLVLAGLNNKENYAEFVRKNIALSLEDLNSSQTPDLFLMQCSGACEDLQHMLNMAHNRIREWVGYTSLIVSSIEDQ